MNSNRNRRQHYRGWFSLVVFGIVMLTRQLPADT